MLTRQTKPKFNPTVKYAIFYDIHDMKSYPALHHYIKPSGVSMTSSLVAFYLIFWLHHLQLSLEMTNRPGYPDNILAILKFNPQCLLSQTETLIQEQYHEKILEQIRVEKWIQPPRLCLSVQTTCHEPTKVNLSA